MLDEIAKQFMVFVGFFGAFVAGVIGLITRHTDQDEGINWGRVWRETPIAIFSGMLAHGIGAWMDAPLQIVIPMASAFAYIGPAVVIGLLQAALNRKIGSHDGKKDRR